MKSIAWLGVAGLKIATDNGWILVDPYLSRHSKFETLFRPLLPKVKTIEPFLNDHPNVEAIFISHAHSDHAADIPEFAKRTNAKICGSKSLGVILRTFDADKNFVNLEENPIITGESWRVTAIASRHGKAILGKEPLPGEITKFPKKPRVFHYRTGAVFNFLIEIDGASILHFGSAELVEGNLSKALVSPVDIAFFCVPGWNKERALERFLSVAPPKVLVPFHYDDFSRPSQREKVKTIVGIDLDGFMASARKIAPETKVVMLKPFERIELQKLVGEQYEAERTN